MSFRDAINAKCKECIYDPIGGSGTWRAQTEACTSRDCPLFPVRPVSIKVKKHQIEDPEGKLSFMGVITTSEHLNAQESSENVYIEPILNHPTAAAASATHDSNQNELGCGIN